MLTGTKICESINLKISIRAGVGAVFGYDKSICAQGLPCLTGEYIAFNKNLVIAPAVNSLVQEVLIQVIVDVLMTKATCGASSARVSPVVVMICDMKMTGINIPQCITVANQGALPVVMEVVPRDSDPIGSSNNIQLAIIVIRADLDRDLRAEFW